MKFHLTLSFCFLIFGKLYSQAPKPKTSPYKNPSLSTEVRVKDLLSRMTIQEKVAQMQCIWSGGKKKIFDDNGQFDDKKQCITSLTASVKWDGPMKGLEMNIKQAKI